MADDANWVINKGGEGTPAGLALKERRDREAKLRKEREAEAKAEDKGRGSKNDPKGADAGKGRSKDDPKGADDRKDENARK